MSRVSVLERMYAKKRKSALDFNFDALWAPPLLSLVTQADIQQLYKIATSVRYNANLEKKYEMIDAIMKPRGFKRFNCGTNRVVYNYLNDTTFCVKIALDKAGIRDSPAEFRNQELLKPFCCRIFEVDPTGVIAVIERVNPISSVEEFLSVADDVFNMMITKVIGRLVIDDVGASKPFNYGIRYNSNGISFGPVIIDFPYVHELDGSKLVCVNEVPDRNGIKIKCGGEIDYTNGLDALVCTKCGKTYHGMDLAKDQTSVIRVYDENDLDGGAIPVRGKVIRRSDNKVLFDSGYSSKVYLTKDKFLEALNMKKPVRYMNVSRYERLRLNRAAEHVANYRKKIADDYRKANDLIIEIVSHEMAEYPSRTVDEDGATCLKIDCPIRGLVYRFKPIVVYDLEDIRLDIQYGMMSRGQALTILDRCSTPEELYHAGLSNITVDDIIALMKIGKVDTCKCSDTIEGIERLYEEMESLENDEPEEEPTEEEPVEEDVDDILDNDEDVEEIVVKVSNKEDVSSVVDRVVDAMTKAIEESVEPEEEETPEVQEEESDFSGEEDSIGDVSREREYDDEKYGEYNHVQRARVDESSDAYKKLQDRLQSVKNMPSDIDDLEREDNRKPYFDRGNKPSRRDASYYELGYRNSKHSKKDRKQNKYRNRYLNEDMSDY